MKKILFLILFSIILLACPPSDNINENCIGSYFDFSIPVTFQPSEKTINFGDTITITSTFSENLPDIHTGEIFSFEDIDFRSIVTFAKLDTPKIENFLYYPYTIFFNFYTDSLYHMKIEGNSIAFDYLYTGKEYFVQFKFIPKRKGIYYFQFGSALLSASKSVQTPIIHSKNGDCKTNKWNPNFITNNGNNHKELLKESIYEFYNQNVYEKWDQNHFIYGRYCFKVE